MDSNHKSQPRTEKSLIPAASILAAGLIISALIFKSDVLSNLFFVPPGPGYQKVSDQFKQQMESGTKGRVFAKTQRYDGVKVHYVTFENDSKSYRVSYSIVLHDTEKNIDFNYGSSCSLSPWGSNSYAGSCERLYDPETGHIGSAIQITAH